MKAMNGHRQRTFALFANKTPPENRITEPDNWDFVHFATMIGVASQTADIAFTAKRLRRIGTVHSVISFAFNTAILALTINLLAGLF